MRSEDIPSGPWRVLSLAALRKTDPTYPTCVPRRMNDGKGLARREHTVPKGGKWPLFFTLFTTRRSHEMLPDLSFWKYSHLFLPPVVHLHLVSQHRLTSTNPVAQGPPSGTRVPSDSIWRACVSSPYSVSG